MLLTASYVLRPVTSVSFFVIEETADAKLLSGCAVPASPVSGAGGFMSKDAIKPVAMVCADGGIYINRTQLAHHHHAALV